MCFSLIFSLCNLRKIAVAFSGHCLTRELCFLVSSGEFFSEGLAIHQKVNRIWTKLLLLVVDPSYCSWDTDVPYPDEAINISTLGFLSMEYTCQDAIGVARTLYLCVIKDCPASAVIGCWVWKQSFCSTQSIKHHLCVLKQGLVKGLGILGLIDTGSHMSVRGCCHWEDLGTLPLSYPSFA